MNTFSIAGALVTFIGVMMMILGAIDRPPSQFIGLRATERDGDGKAIQMVWTTGMQSLVIRPASIANEIYLEPLMNPSLPHVTRKSPISNSK